ncbi:hypothetical protein ACFYN3_35755 [Streptomyces lavendulae]|uniref:hypothetical protein n=1 Tax=Streptomyces lavendulae TaxID=1914 RepID=UPI0036ADF0AC
MTRVLLSADEAAGVRYLDYSLVGLGTDIECLIGNAPTMDAGPSSPVAPSSRRPE